MLVFMSPTQSADEPRLRKPELRAAVRAARATRRKRSQDPVLTPPAGWDPARFHTVLGYAALPGEPDVDGLLQQMHDAGAEVWLPVTTPHRPLAFARVTGPLAEIPATGPWGIREPAGPRVGAPELRLGGDGTGREALVLVPGLGFDRTGARLGQGAGFYDRTFGPQGLRPLTGTEGTQVVGVCFAAELGVPVDARPWDLRVPAVLTESGQHNTDS
ncbi:hypothetical protein NQ038_03910 [Brevibacterium sp. 50QC2O2]|uniref:5-formyltetrahydrofolate cyclo-ligase n=1 Tax=Brevibacterium TaxID=1696 RepID=UPI00211CBB90|nr:MULTISPECIES: 5-formyltetrahydrofolate cyclo-ligase [unclassified Brevibacterium]MCQ9385164.1 hypothetical protein [Brevibacterium sp. 68QC2CO]MCQ9387787.1 hypothetical protein [Brevibacterium sp. 50QC2O2]